MKSVMGIKQFIIRVALLTLRNIKKVVKNGNRTHSTGNHEGLPVSRCTLRFSMRLNLRAEFTAFLLSCQIAVMILCGESDVFAEPGRRDEVARSFFVWKFHFSEFEWR